MATSATVHTIRPENEPSREGPEPAFLAQLQRILDSPEFSTSKRLSEFFAFIGEASLAGRHELDQYEIAERFLHRGRDFNPLDDASVRKLASQTRRKLESYYAQPDRHDPVIVTLPLRSYLPRFRYRETAASGAWPPPATDQGSLQETDAPTASEALPSAEPLEETGTGPSPSGGFEALGRRSRLALLGVAAVVATFAAVAAWGPARPDPNTSAPPRGVFDLVTASGDIMHAGADLESTGILLGPAAGPGEDVVARMEFTPERATQQAGLLLFQSPDEYVKLGRHFNDRARLEFGYETDGRYRKTPQTFAFDPAGQTGAPIWLKIRRRQDEYLGFVSSDGTSWTRFGEDLAPPAPFGPAQLAIFGFNGRTNAPPTSARFSHIGAGLWFHDRGDPETSLAAAQDWAASPASSEGIRLLEDRGALLVKIQPTDTTSNWRLMTKVPEGDWTLETKLDFVSISGAFAGLSLIGSSGELRLIRWDLNGGSITLEHLVNTQVSVPDFAGNPPVTLRLAATGGVLRGFLSRDGTSFTEIDEEVDLSALGSDLRFGIVTGTSSWSDAPRQVESRFYYVQRMVTSLEPFPAER